jgi:hypothetical protein
MGCYWRSGGLRLVSVFGADVLAEDLRLFTRF